MVNSLKENYYYKFLKFLRSHNLYEEEIFKYIWNKCSRFDYIDDDYHSAIGIYYIYEKNAKLIDFNLVVPFIESDITVLINIHEYLHAYMAYYRLGKKFKLDDSCEVLPLVFEKLYFSENNNDKLNNYMVQLNEIRFNSGEQKYILGIKVADELIKSYNKDSNLEKLNKNSKKLVKKYKYLM